MQYFECTASTNNYDETIVSRMFEIAGGLVSFLPDLEQIWNNFACAVQKGAARFVCYVLRLSYKSQHVLSSICTTKSCTVVSNIRSQFNTMAAATRSCPDWAVLWQQGHGLAIAVYRDATIPPQMWADMGI